MFLKYVCTYVCTQCHSTFSSKYIYICILHIFSTLPVIQPIKRKLPDHQLMGKYLCTKLDPHGKIQMQQIEWINCVKYFGISFNYIYLFITFYFEDI